MIQTIDFDAPRISAFRKFACEVAPGRLKPELTGSDFPCAEFVCAIGVDREKLGLFLSAVSLSSRIRLS